MAKFDIMGSNKKIFEDAMEEIFATGSSARAQGEELKIEQHKKENINEALIGYYNKHKHTDFEYELRMLVQPVSMEKLKAHYMGMDIAQELKDRREKIIGQELAGVSGVDKNTLDSTREKLKEEKGNDTKGVSSFEDDLKAQVCKAVYDSVFERYSRALTHAKEIQAKDASLTIGDKEGTELIIYEKMLQNVESKYMAHTSKSIYAQDENGEPNEIKKKADALKEEVDNKDKLKNYRAGKELNRLDELKEKREAIGEKIVELGVKAKDMDSLEFDYQMQELRKEYFEISLQISSIDPSLEERFKELRTEEGNEKYAEKMTGKNPDGETIVSKDLHDKRIEEQEGKNKINKNPEKNPECVAKNMITDEGEAQLVAVEKLRAECNGLIADGKFERAEEVLKSLEGMLDINIESQDSMRDKNVDAPKQNEQQVKNSKNENEQESSQEPSQKQRSAMVQEWENAKYSEDDIGKQDELKGRLARCDENILVLKGKTDRTVDEIGQMSR